MIVSLVNAAWFSDCGDDDADEDRDHEAAAPSRHLPDPVIAPPVLDVLPCYAYSSAWPRTAPRLHRLDEPVGEPFVHLVEGAVDARDQRDQPVGVLGREVRERGVGLGHVRALAARRLRHHVAADRQRDPHLHVGELVVVEAGLLEDAGERGRVVQPARRAAREHDLHDLRAGHEVLEAAEHPRPQLVLPRSVAAGSRRCARVRMRPTTSSTSSSRSLKWR